MASLKKRISAVFPELCLREDLPYRELTTLGVGTVLPLMAEPADDRQLQRLLKLLNSGNIPFFVFGGGSNIIGMDGPYNGVGIRLRGENFDFIRKEGTSFVCGAGAFLPELVRTAAANGCAGLSPLAGIPGTAGGAVRMNAGANGACIGDCVRSISGFHADGTEFTLSGNDLKWAYRRGAVPAGAVVTEITLELTGSTPEAEQKIMAEVLESRRQREPGGRTAGCAFRNVSEMEPAGKLIDQCGLKGVRCEDMQISEKHANYMVNLTGRATAGDYLKLLIFIRRAVSDRSGFFLKLEQIPLDPAFEETLYREVPAIRVNVLYGGASSEREVSLRSGAAVAKALENGGFDVELSDIKQCAVTDSMKRCDVIYPVLHGGFGEDGRLQKLLEENSLRFACSGSAGCAAVMDKIITKKLLDKTRMPTAKWKIITRDDCAFPAELGLPVILKVPCEGSTVGIIKVDREDEWENALKEEFAMTDVLLAESFIKGVEISIPVIGGKAFDAIEIRSPKGFYDYDAKYVYKDGHTEYFCPPVSAGAEAVARARQLAEEFYFITGCRDLVRVDFIIGEDNVPYILEGNALPGCTATSLVPKSAGAAGVSFEALTAGMVYSAMRRPVSRHETVSGEKLSGFLAKICIWMFRITLFLCAAVLATSGVIALLTGLPGWPLVIAGVLMVFTELIFAWLKNMRKK